MRRRRAGVAVLVFLVLEVSAVAQLDVGRILPHVRVRLAFAGGVCDSSATVTLMGHSGPIAQGSANDQCMVDFRNVPEGSYHLYVSGPGMPYTDSGIVTMSAMGQDEFEVKVQRSAGSDQTFAPAASALISTSDLAAPERARKEFDKANRLIARQDFKTAAKKLNNAIAIYPGYAAAYNNLGVVYSRLGDHAQESEALQKAIGLNDHFALAFLNLGRMHIAVGDFAAAEKALNQASTVDPTDAMALVLLAYSQFSEGHFDDAIATSRRAHELLGPHAFAHRIAARSYLKKRDGKSAVVELELCLKEEPTGSRADNARQDLATVQGILREEEKRASR